MLEELIRLNFIVIFTAVKWLNIILSIYLIVLTSIPCSDMEVNSLAHESIAHSTGHESHSHDKQKDTCPPFCACNCCGAQILVYQPFLTFEFQKVLSEIKTKEPFYKSVFASSFFGSIWQPPQIV